MGCYWADFVAQGIADMRMQLGAGGSRHPQWVIDLVQNGSIQAPSSLLQYLGLNPHLDNLGRRKFRITGDIPGYTGLEARFENDLFQVHAERKALSEYSTSGNSQPGSVRYIYSSRQPCPDLCVLGTTWRVNEPKPTNYPGQIQIP